MNKNKKVFLTSFVAVVIVVSILSIYNFTKNKTDNTNNTIKNTDNINIENNKKTQQENIMVDTKIIDKKIFISNRCRGCGKCMMIDPEHFRLNETIRKAEVISQENLDSKNILTAISMCPDMAISLN